MVNKIKITMAADGQSMEYLHADVVSLHKFGSKQVRRASDVEFDHSRQEWVATLMDGREIARDANRDTVLRVEREVIEDMLVRGESVPGCT